MGKFCPCSVVLGLARGSRVRYTEWVLSCIPFFCDPMDCSPLGSSVHENFQARILEWAATAYSREPSQTRIEPPSLAFPALQADSLPLSYLGRPILNEASLIQKETCPLTTLLCKVLNRIPTLCDFFFLRPGMCRESPETPLYSETSLSFNSFLYPIFSIKLLAAKESTLWGLGSNEKQQEKEKRKPVRPPFLRGGSFKILYSHFIFKPAFKQSSRQSHCSRSLEWTHLKCSSWILWGGSLVTQNTPRQVLSQNAASQLNKYTPPPIKSHRQGSLREKDRTETPYPTLKYCRISCRRFRMMALYSPMRSFLPSTRQVRFGRGLYL